MSIRLVAMDMDDTFLHFDKSVSEVNLQAVKDCAAAGIYVVPASGRPFCILPEELKALDCLEYSINVNGSRVRNVKTGEYVFSRLIPFEHVIEMLELGRRCGAVSEACLDEVFYITGSEEEAEFEFMDPSLEWFIRFMHVKTPDLLTLVKEKKVGAEKMLFMFPDRSKLEPFRKEVQEKYGVTVSSSLEGELEITAAGVSKGTALLKLAEHLGIDRSETMAVGDSGNDMDMLNAAGFSVAMGNAAEEIKNRTDAVTWHCDSDGFAHAVRRWALKETK